jgi:SAM-dependent methyltransferase
VAEVDEASDFVRSIKLHRESAQNADGRLRGVVSLCAGLTDTDLPPLWAMQKIGSDGPEHFRAVMIDIFSDLYRRFQLASQSRVLDIGCGCGRLAYPFAALLGEEGRYFGMDVWEDGVALCQAKLAAPHMTFHHVQALNNYYFDAASSGRNDFKLPFVPTGDLDLVFAISVFTHLIEEDARAYLGEIARVLKPDGAAYITAFIIDRFFHDYVDRTGNHTGVAEVSKGHYQAYSGQDFLGGFTFPRWQEIVTDAGLEIASFELGSWAEKPGARPYQDTFVLVRQALG